MKKAMLFVLCLIATTLAFAQKDLNSSQLKLRTEIFNFLKEEGFTPEIDSDGDIKFKRQGNTCFVIIDEKNTSPMYVKMERYIAVPDNYSGLTSRLAAEQLSRRFKAIKCCYLASSNTFRITAEMFLRSSEPFKEVFYQLCSSMDDLKDEISDALEDEIVGGSANSRSTNIGLPLSISKIEIANTYKDGTKETDFGETIYDENTMYFKPRITYTGNINGNVTLKVKWFDQDGSLVKNSNAPYGFTQEGTYMIEKGNGKTLVMRAFGSEDKGNWKAGTYRIEIWHENTCLKKYEFEVEEKTDSSKQLYLDVLVAAMKEELGGLPSTISAGKFNIEITEMIAVSKSDKVITVFRMPKSQSAISDTEKEQAKVYCENFCLGVNMEWKKLQSDLKEIGLENLQMVYRLEDKNGFYITGEKK